MREEAREIVDTLPEIESWADKLKSLAEEVETQHDYLEVKRVLSEHTCLTLEADPCAYVSGAWERSKNQTLVKCVSYCPMALPVAESAFVILCPAPEQHSRCDHLDAAW